MRENQPGLSHERPGHRGSARLVHDSTGKGGRSGQVIGHENKNWIGIVRVKGRLGGKEWTVIVASVAGVKQISYQINCSRRQRTIGSVKKDKTLSTLLVNSNAISTSHRKTVPGAFILSI